MNRWHYEKHKAGIALKHNANKGASAVEFAIILPILIAMVFGAIDFGRLFHARLIMTNLAREGANLASRSMNLPTGAYSALGLITLLQAGSSPLDMAADGRIYIWKIKCGVNGSPNPYVDNSLSANRGSLNVASNFGTGLRLGLNSEIYEHLVFNSPAADISEINVVEVFYRFTPITPVVMGTRILSSSAVF